MFARREVGGPVIDPKSPPWRRTGGRSRRNTAGTIGRVPTTRYRCSSCGNLTRFDVVGSRRTRAFHHYTVGGELTIEEEDVLDERIEQVTCRWCGASGEKIEQVPVEESA